MRTITLVPTERSIIVIMFICITLLGGAIAAPPEHSDPSLAPWFKSLSASDSTACCSMADCRRTKSRLTAEGYEALIDDTWVAVPWDRVLARTTIRP